MINYSSQHDIMFERNDNEWPPPPPTYASTHVTCLSTTASSTFRVHTTTTTNQRVTPFHHCHTDRQWCHVTNAHSRCRTTTSDGHDRDGRRGMMARDRCGSSSSSREIGLQGSRRNPSRASGMFYFVLFLNRNGAMAPQLRILNRRLECRFS